MAEIKHEIHRVLRGNEEFDLRSSAIWLPASHRRLVALAALICVLAVVAYLTTRGWSDAARDLSHGFGHLPRPLQTLLGGSRLARLLAAAQ
jgi:hypothetical protein